MNRIDLFRVDLNLMVVLQTLLEERHVGRAANRLNLTQSAVSHSLRRLRVLFGDPLFFRIAQGIVPTERALQLEPALQDVLTGMAAIIRPHVFDPATANDRIVIGITDYANVVVMPALAEYLERKAPNMRITLRVEHPDLDIGNLDAENLDFSIAPVWGSFPKRIAIRPLFTDRFVLVCRQGHPVFTEKCDLEQLLRVRRIVVTSRVDESSVSEPSLIKAGLPRYPAMTIPHFLAAPFVLERTDHVAFLPERLSRQLSLLGRLDIHEPPIALPAITMAMFYHRQRVNASPCLRWVAGAIKEALGVSQRDGG